MKHLFAMTLLLGALQLTGCHSLPPQEVIHSAEDHELAVNVYRVLRAELRGNSNLIGVTASDGVVTLHGTVNDRALQAQAVTVAENVPGVTGVINQLGL